MPTFQRPVAGNPTVTCSFNCHNDRNSVNPGVDYGVATGTDVFAPEDGIVTNAQWSDSVGYWIGIDFDNGWGCDLLHNSKLLVKKGDRVKRGEHIAEAGGTGSAATGPHVHWSLRSCHGSHTMNVKNVDPEKYVGESSSEGGSDMPFLIHHTNGANQQIYYFDGINLEVASGPEKNAGFVTVKVDGPDGLTRYKNFKANTIALLAGSLTEEQDTILRSTATKTQVDGIPKATADLINGDGPTPPDPEPELPRSWSFSGDVEFDSETHASITGDIVPKP